MKKTMILAAAASCIIGASLFLEADASGPRNQVLDKVVSSQEVGAPAVQMENPIPIQIEDGSLKFSCQFDNPYVLSESSSEYVYLLMTAEGGQALEAVDRTPLNIAMVLDRSGSMGSDNKLEYAKTACQVVIDNLSKEDKISVVAYDDNVNVIHGSGVIANGTILKNKVARLSPGGSTNLSGGMLEGYDQVLSAFKQQNVNRVLLLSDGLANKGISDPSRLKKIVEQKFAEQGIAISTFGIGADFNEDLMTDLSEYGRGNYYFIASADKIPEIFSKELNGLLSVVAQNTSIKLQFPSEYFTVDKVFGYTSTVSEGRVDIQFNDVFAEEEKSVLVRFKRLKSMDKELNFTANLTYDDVRMDYERVQSDMAIALKTTDDAALLEASISQEVMRNIVLFESAERFEEAARRVDQGDYDGAKQLIHANGVYMDSSFEWITPDSTLLRQREMNMKYGEEIDNIEMKSAEEIKYMQKSNKSESYSIRKKRE